MSKQVFTEVLKTKEFEQIIAEEFETTLGDAENILRTFAGAIKRAIYEENKGIRLGDFATLKIQEVPERNHRVPSTGETVTKPEHYAVKLAVNKRFKKDLEELSIK